MRLIKNILFVLFLIVSVFHSIESKAQHTDSLTVKDTVISSVKRTSVERDSVYKTMDLSDVVVHGDRSQHVRRMANGQRFFLSEKAKSLKNPFQALQEIPLLISDESNSTLRMLNGKTPLMLVDGNRMNSGIAPINPSEIESVEVITSVPARYLQEGVCAIVNIRLKRKARSYVWVQTATRHDLPIDKGFGVFYFEVGNTKYSLYGRTSYDYTHNDNMESTVNRYNTTYQQQYDATQCTNAHSWLGELLFKMKTSPKDYIAMHAYGSTAITKSNENGYGFYSTDIMQDYSFNSFNREKSSIFTSSFYYKHSFAKDNDLEIRAAYNFNCNDYNATRSDYNGGIGRNAGTIYKNKRNSGNVDIDYSKDYDNGRSVNIGSHSTVQFDDINQISTGYPIFKHQLFNQYLYGSYGGQINHIEYLASIGMEGIWLKAGITDNHYIRPRSSLSATWNVNDNNSLMLSYTLSNAAPSVENLNPYNTSTDSLVVERGNPYLIPEISHLAEMEYTFNVGSLYIMPSAYYKRINDLIQIGGQSNNGIYTQSYINSGHFSQVSAGADLSYKFPWGRVNGGGGWRADCYQGESAKHSVYATFGFNARVKRFAFYTDIEYNSRETSAVSVIKYYHPSYANIQVNYNITPDLYIALCLQHFTGTFRTKTTVDDGSFHSVINTRYKDQSFRPWILVRYTLQKNPDKKIKLDKVLTSKENGISLKR